MVHRVPSAVDYILKGDEVKEEAGKGNRQVVIDNQQLKDTMSVHEREIYENYSITTTSFLIFFHRGGDRGISRTIL